MKDLKIPAAILTFLAAQLGGAVWWSAQMDRRVQTLEAESLSIAREKQMKRFDRRSQSLRCGRISIFSLA